MKKWGKKRIRRGKQEKWDSELQKNKNRDNKKIETKNQEPKTENRKSKTENRKSKTETKKNKKIKKQKTKNKKQKERIRKRKQIWIYKNKSKRNSTKKIKLNLISTKDA